jgi:hypothetical protein
MLITGFKRPVKHTVNAVEQLEKHGVVYWIYTSVIRPMLTYLTTIKIQFAHIQYITCLGMSGCMSTTLAAALEILLPLLQLVVEKKARHTADRLHYSGHF